MIRYIRKAQAPMKEPTPIFGEELRAGANELPFCDELRAGASAGRIS